MKVENVALRFLDPPTQDQYLAVACAIDVGEANVVKWAPFSGKEGGKVICNITGGTFNMSTGVHLVTLEGAKDTMKFLFTGTVSGKVGVRFKGDTPFFYYM